MKKLISVILVLCLLALAPCACLEEEEKTTFDIVFSLADCGEDSLAILNGALGSLELSELSLEDISGLLVKRFTSEGVSSWYEFTSIKLACVRDAAEEMRIYQIGTAVFLDSNMTDSETFHKKWSDEHPEYVIRTLIQYDYRDAQAFIFTYHEKAQ